MLNNMSHLRGSSAALSGNIVVLNASNSYFAKRKTFPKAFKENSPLRQRPQLQRPILYPKYQSTKDFLRSVLTQHNALDPAKELSREPPHKRSNSHLSAAAAMLLKPISSTRKATYFPLGSQRDECLPTIVHITPKYKEGPTNLVQWGRPVGSRKSAAPSKRVDEPLPKQLSSDDEDSFCVPYSPRYFGQ